MNLLEQELDRLPLGWEQLEGTEAFMAAGRGRINKQVAKVAGLFESGHNTKHATGLLIALAQTEAFLERYRERALE